MKSGDILVKRWQEIIANRDMLKRIAFSVDLARVQTWWWWKEFKDANKN